MPFVKSSSALAAEEVQRLLNKGYVYSLTAKKNGAVVSHHYDKEQATRAKTRKTRLVRTQDLLIEKVYNNGKD